MLTSQEEHENLRQRAKYEIRRPPGYFDCARTDRTDENIFTRYVVEEWWCGTKIREQKHQVELSIAGRSNQGGYSMKPFPARVSAHAPQLSLSPSHYFLSDLVENTTSKSL